MLLVTTLLAFFSVGLVLGNYGYNSDGHPDEYSSCNKSSIKITNKVPVYDLCYWEKIEWKNFVKRTDVSACNLHGSDGNYIPSRCIPTKIRLYDGKVYVIIDRNVGVYSTLSYFDLKDVSESMQCPKLECFRSCSRNQLADISECNDDSLNFLINVRDIQFTSCKRAWLLDIGAYFNGKTPIIQRRPRICLYDMSTSTPNQEYCRSFPSQYYNDGNQFGLNSIQVNEDGGPGRHFVYIFNAISATIYVYSEQQGSYWSIRATPFRPEPSKSVFYFTSSTYDEYQTIVHDGIFSGALDKYGLYVSAKASDDLYFISYKILNDRSKENCNELAYNIKDVGTFNDKGQTYGIVRNENVLFFIQPQNHALVCGNKKDIITPDSLQYLIVDRCRFPHLASIDIYRDKAKRKEIYLLSNNLIDIQANGFDCRKKNFAITYVDIEEIEALYPQCLSYFEDYYGDHNLKDEVALAHLIAAQKPGHYELYDNSYQHKKCPETYEPADKPCLKCLKYNNPTLESLIRSYYDLHSTSSSSKSSCNKCSRSA